MSIAQGRYEPGMPVRFCTDGVELSAQSKPRSAASMRSIAAEGVRQTSHSEFRGAADRSGRRSASMIQRNNFQFIAQTSARVSVMPHIAHPDDNGLQPEHGETTGSSGGLMELSGSEPRQSSARTPRKGSRRSGK